MDIIIMFLRAFGVAMPYLNQKFSRNAVKSVKNDKAHGHMEETAVEQSTIGFFLNIYSTLVILFLVGLTVGVVLYNVFASAIINDVPSLIMFIPYAFSSITSMISCIYLRYNYVNMQKYFIFYRQQIENLIFYNHKNNHKATIFSYILVTFFFVIILSIMMGGLLYYWEIQSDKTIIFGNITKKFLNHPMRVTIFVLAGIHLAIEFATITLLAFLICVQATNISKIFQQFNEAVNKYVYQNNVATLFSQQDSNLGDIPHERVKDATVHQLREEFQKICYIVEKTNDICGPLVFVLYAHHICVALFSAFVTINQTQLSDMGNIFLKAFFIYIAVSSVLILIYTLKKMSTVNDQAHSSMITLGCVDMSRQTLRENIEFSVLMGNLRGPPIALTGWNYFVIDRGNLLTTVSVYITYIIVLLQF